MTPPPGTTSFTRGSSVIRGKGGSGPRYDLPRPSSEIAILRVLILHAAARCDLESARRGIETVARLFKIPRFIARDNPREELLADSLDDWAEALMQAEEAE